MSRLGHVIARLPDADESSALAKLSSRYQKLRGESSPQDSPGVG